MKYSKKPLLILIFILIISPMLAACGSAATKGEKPNSDWSRSLQMGERASGSMGLFVNEDQQQVYMVWTETDDDGMYIRFKRLDQFSVPSATNSLRFPGRLRYPRLVPAIEGNMHLFWASRVSGASGWHLWHALMSPSGELVGEARQISTDEDDVGAYMVTSDHSGGALAAWSHRNRGGIYLTHLDEQGEEISGRMQIAEEGESPALRVNPEGIVHLAWMIPGGVFYVETPINKLETAIGQELLVAEIKTGTGDSLVGPQLGLSDGWVYIIWSILSQSGLEAGTARTNYIAFPQGSPEYDRSDPVRLFPEEEQTYQPYAGTLGLTELVDPPQVAWESTDYVMQPSSMLGENAELAVGLSAYQQFRLNPFMQIAVAVLSDGEFKGYTYASKSDQISDDSVIYVGPSGSLYAVWREGASGVDIYYATTEPTAVASLDSLGLSDFTDAALQGSIEIAVSIAFLPIIGFGWMLVGLIVVGGWKIFRDDDDLHKPFSWVPLILGFIAYSVVKFATLPTMSSYVPFSAWIFIPPELRNPLIIGVPVVIPVIALIVAQRARRRFGDSATTFYMIAALVDALLTLALYGVNFLGVF